MESRRALAATLEAVADFRSPQAHLEQYLTPPEVAAHVCHLAALQGDLRGRTVVDLGTGTGMLALGAAHGDPERVVGADVDGDALAVARENARRVDPPVPVSWVQSDASTLGLCTEGATVLSNPPFGAQRGRRGADRAFLEVARSIGSVSYTIHNEGSQAFVESYAADEGGTVTHAFRAPFDIERRFDFHDEASREIQAEIFRIEWDGA